MSSSTIDPGDKSPAAIEEDVERTRADVSDTLDALRGKLAPSQIVEELVDRVSEYARGSGGADFARNLGGAMRDNPLPVLLIGAGVGWLMLSDRGSGQATGHARDALRLPAPPRRSSNGEGHGSGVAAAVGDAASRVGSQVGDAASRVAEAGSNLVSGAREGGAHASQGVASIGRGAAAATRDGWSSATDLMQTQPLLVGLLGVVMGAALGAALPRTQAEDDLLGEASDAATARVTEFGRETAGQVRAAAAEHLHDTTNAAAEGYARVKEQLDHGSLSGAATAAGEAVSTTAKAAGTAAGNMAGDARQRMTDDETPSGAQGRPLPPG